MNLTYVPRGTPTLLWIFGAVLGCASSPEPVLDHRDASPDAGHAFQDAVDAFQDPPTGMDAGADSKVDPRDSCDFYVGTNGDDTHPGTFEQPFRTIAYGAGRLSPGETLCVRAGTYDESFYNSIPSGSGDGTSWSGALPVTLRAYPGEERQVIVQPGSAPFVLYTGYYREDSYIVIDGFVFDGSNVEHAVLKIDQHSHHIRISHSEIRNSPGNGVLVGTSTDYLEFMDVEVHDLGAYGFYIGGNHILIDGATIHDVGGYGIHAYAGACERPDGCVSNNIIRNSRVFRVRRFLHSSGDWKDPVGIGIFTGPGNIVVDNVVTGTGSDAHFWGIRVQYGAAAAQIYNNTLFDMEMCIYIDEPDAVIRNNVMYQCETPIGDYGAGTDESHNLTNDPRFVDAAAGDFRLQADSPAIDAGTAIDMFDTDMEGTPRPQGSGWDIGAFEYR